MDPISAAFTSYLELVSSGATSRMTDVLGTEVQAVVVEHHNVNIPYAYQMWKLRPDSACASSRQNVVLYSKCTVAAQSLFKETCAHLQANPEHHWKHRKLKNMYCGAAATYQPTMASVQWSNEPSPLQQARTDCNLAISKLMTFRSAETEKKKEKACGIYRSLRGQ